MLQSSQGARGIAHTGAKQAGWNLNRGPRADTRLGGKGLGEGGVQQERLHETEGGLGNFHGTLQKDDRGKEGGHARGLENL